jgi:hypothetical protein
MPKPTNPGRISVRAEGSGTKLPGGYVVRDANGQALAHMYARATIAEAMQAKVLTQSQLFFM